MLKNLLSRLTGKASHRESFQELFKPRPGVPLLRLDGVSKIFQAGEEKTYALDDVYLDVEKGEFICVSGPSGSGKSTLLHTLGLLETPSQGKVLLNGRDVSSLRPAELAWIRNRAVGFIFQNFHLIGDLTALENVETPLTYIGLPTADRRERALRALARVNMDPYARRYPSQLTGGEQQRVAVARAIVVEPLILMADEPTGSLDSKNGEAVMQILEGLNSSGATLFLVSHNLAFARRARRTVYIFDGKVSDQPSPEFVATE